MRVVLRADIAGVGKRGDILDVSDGYGRNYLLPTGKAIFATNGIDQQAAAMRRSRDVKDAKDREGAEAIARRLVPLVIHIQARAGSEGRLFGSVTAADIVEAVEKQAGVALDRRKLTMTEPIKAIGTHDVGVRLHTDVECRLTVEVSGS